MPSSRLRETSLTYDISAETNAQSSPLLRLPAELRNRIFGYVLGGHEVRFVWEDKPRHQRSNRIFEIQRAGENSVMTSEEKKRFLSLTLASRQIYTETAMLPFAANTFVFVGLRHPEEAEKWLAQLFLPAQQNAIATVQCPIQNLFFDFAMGLVGLVASRHCLGIFRQLEGLQCLIVETENFRLNVLGKEVVAGKIRRAHGKDKLKIVFL